jgi:hypothetical protein
MKNIHPISNQKGFFAVGLGLAMLTAFGVIGITTNRSVSDENKTAQVQPTQTSAEQQVAARSN